MYRVIVILLFTLFGPSSFALDAKDLAPIKAQSEQTALYREILDRLATRHYRGQEINDDLSKRYLAEYIEMLDPLKSYFLQSDIDNFNQWSTKLDDLARRGDVEPGFIMFNRLRDIALAQLKENIALLE
ncbi:MAG: tail-specific protease, partial [Porticoccaceae bacterium]